ncbi:MAG: TetR/AcrR family transcriptional regulator, partial [Clostridia bacterium]
MTTPTPDRRILDAAVRVFGRHGFAGATTDELARDAGLTKGALYWYFQDKRRLFAETVATVIRAFEAALADVPDRQAALDALGAFGDGHPEMLRFVHRLHGELVGDGFPDEARALTEWYGRLRARIGDTALRAWWVDSHP